MSEKYEGYHPLVLSREITRSLGEPTCVLCGSTAVVVEMRYGYWNRYNRDQWCEKCLTSILDQGVKIEQEIAAESLDHQENA